ncbi:MAG: BACON domain-containing protein [Bacteroidales bacterium]|nr:BACON domain-containing protein [Bacteroidales bacterium]
MKKHIITALALIMALAVSCNTDIEVVPSPSCPDDFYITASCGAPDTRTQRDFDGKMYWSPGDEIAVVVFDKTGHRLTPFVKFVATNDAPASTAKFRLEADPDFDYQSFKEVWDNETYDHVAVYPYDKYLSMGYENYYSRYAVKYTLAFSQNGVPGTFEPGTYPSLAWSHDSNFSFKHPMSGLKFSVQSENVVKATMSVAFDNNNVHFAVHKNYIGIKEDGSVSNTFEVSYDTETTNSLELIPQGGSFTPGEAYYFVCPPSSTVESVTLTLDRADGSKLARTINKNYQFKSGTFASMMEVDSGCEWKTDVPVVDPAVIEVGNNGNEITFGVKCAADYTVQTDADWLLDMKAEGDALSGTRTHTFVVKRNEGAARTATINLSNSAATVPVTINQAAGEPLPGYPSIVRHHSALIANNYNCAHYASAASSVRQFRLDHGDYLEFTNIFINSKYRDESFQEPTQYRLDFEPVVVLDGRREGEDADVILKYTAETDAIYPPMTSIGFSSGIEGSTLTVDLKVYAYKAGTYRIAVNLTRNALAVGSFNIYNVSMYHATDNTGYDIAGQEYELSAGINEIHLAKTIKSSYASISDLFSIFAYVQVPYGDLPVLRDGNYTAEMYVDNCRFAPVGTTVEPEVN